MALESHGILEAQSPSNIMEMHVTELESYKR
jgi:hypothetical protein